MKPGNLPTVQEIVRPDPAHWLLYAFGAGLPVENRSWVLNDVTASTWVVRHLARAVLQIVPVAVLLWLLLPLDRTITSAAIGLGTVMGLIYSAAFVWGAAEHRAVKAGYPEGFAEAVRERRAEGRPLHEAVRIAREER